VRADCFDGKRGLPIRATVSDSGLPLLARLLDRNDTQECVPSSQAGRAPMSGALGSLRGGRPRGAARTRRAVRCIARRGTLAPKAVNHVGAPPAVSDRRGIGGGGGTASSISFETGWTMPSSDFALAARRRSGACYSNLFDPNP